VPVPRRIMEIAPGLLQGLSLRCCPPVDFALALSRLAAERGLSAKAVQCDAPKLLESAVRATLQQKS